MSKMSRDDWCASAEIANEHSLHALIMAAMRKADKGDLSKLRMSFPNVWTELQSRNAVTDGWFPGESRDEKE